MRDERRGRTPVKRRPKPARSHGLWGALVPRGRFARLFVTACLSLIALGGIAALGLYALIATGTVTADIATPYIAQALEARIGGGHKVKIGSTTVETVPGGATAVVVHDIKVFTPDGQLLASAPSAEVELEGSILSLVPKARRIDLVGAEMLVRIAASGHVAVEAGRGATAIPAGPRRAAPPPAAAAPPSGVPLPADVAGQVPGAAGAPAIPPAAADANAEGGTDPLRLTALARWAQELETAGFDGGALADVGLKDGTVIVENESSGRRIVFRHIGVRLNRPADGGAELTFTSQGPHGISTVVARVSPLQGNTRSISMDIKDVSTRDLLQAFSQDHRRFYMDTPLDATFAASLGPEGEVRAASAAISLGAGELGNGEEVQERFVIDYARLGAHLDPARRVIVLDPIVAAKNQNKVALKGEINVPATAQEPWTFAIGPQEVVLAGPEMDEPPLRVTEVVVAGRYTAADKRLAIDEGLLGSDAGGMSFTAAFDFGIPVPAMTFDAVGTAMPVSTIKRFWPASIAPPARQFAVENVWGGTVDGTTVAVKLPLNLIGQKQIPLPDEAIRFSISGQGVNVRPVKGLPPVMDSKIAIAVTGRTVRISMPTGTVVTPQKRKLAVTDGVMYIPDYFPREPTSQIQVKFDGPADAGIEVLGMEPLKGPEGTAFDPSTTRGHLAALLQVNITFRKVPLPEDLDYSLEASLTDFGVDNVFRAQRLEGATVKAFASPAGILLRGDGRLAGAPLAFEFEKKKDAADSDIRVNATLDDAARKRLGVEVPGIFGPVAVKLVGTTSNKDTKARLEVDLTPARIADLIPGLSKPAGKPLKARFVLNDRSRTVRLDDLVLDGSGALLKGSLELSDDGDLISAQFPVFQLSDGDKASLKAETASKVLKIRITGEVMDARGIMKSLVGTSSSGTGKKDATPDVDVDAKIGALTGNNGEVFRQFDLSVSRRGVAVTDFRLTAKLGRSGNVAGEMRRWQGTQKALNVTTSDAGALLRFLDIYAKVDGGEAWLMVDPPRSDDTPQEGVLHIRDFAIRGEPGLERLSSAARDSSGRVVDGSAAFEKAQAQFARTTGKVTFREGAIWGSSAGVTFEGTLNFAADRIGIRGTFVPAYALNNLFSKLPVIGMFLGGGPNEGLLGVTFEIVGSLSGGPTLRINPMSAVAPGFLRKIFEFRSADERQPAR